MSPYWFFQLRLLPWLPFLFLEAKKVRKNSPRLSCPSSLLTLGEGKRQLLLLGESTVAGVGASSASQTLAGNFFRILGESYRIETIGKKGLRVKEAFTLYLKQGNTSTRKVQGIILFLGANDCFLLTAPRQFKGELESLIDQIQVRTEAEWIYLAPIPPVHLFPAFSERMRYFLHRQREFLLREMESIAAKNARVIFHSMPMELEPEFFSTDGIHPSDLGYQKIAELACDRIKLTQTIG